MVFWPEGDPGAGIQQTSLLTHTLSWAGFSAPLSSLRGLAVAAGPPVGQLGAPAMEQSQPQTAGR